jgi:hypothetical protein
LATELRSKRYDVFVGGVPAYSTLGWFDDPVLNTFIRYPEQIARLMFLNWPNRSPTRRATARSTNLRGYRGAGRRQALAANNGTAHS